MLCFMLSQAALLRVLPLVMDTVRAEMHRPVLLEQALGFLRNMVHEANKVRNVLASIEGAGGEVCVQHNFASFKGAWPVHALRCSGSLPYPMPPPPFPLPTSFRCARLQSAILPLVPDVMRVLRAHPTASALLCQGLRFMKRVGDSVRWSRILALIRVFLCVGSAMDKARVRSVPQLDACFWWMWLTAGSLHGYVVVGLAFVDEVPECVLLL